MTRFRSAQLCTFALMLLATFTSIASAQQGRPFQDVQAQIKNLQAQIDALGGAGGGGGLFTAGGGNPAGTIVFSSNSGGGSAVEKEAQLPVAKAGTLHALAVNPFLNGLVGDAVATVRVNGVDTALSVIVPGGSTAVVIADVDIPINAGDLVTLKMDTSSAAGSFLIWKATFLYAAQ